MAHSLERFRSNLELVDRVFGLVRGYLSGQTDEAARRLPRLFARDAVFVPSSALASGSVGPYRGAEQILEFLDATRSQWSRFEIHADELMEVPPNRVVALAHTSAMRADGRGYAGSIGQVWELRGGRVVAITSFQNPAHALEHAGVEPSRLTDPSSLGET